MKTKFTKFKFCDMYQYQTLMYPSSFEDEMNILFLLNLREMHLEVKM